MPELFLCMLHGREVHSSEGFVVTIDVADVDFPVLCHT